MQDGRCWGCGAALSAADYSRENFCRGCSKPTRSCRNCQWYRPGLANDCYEPVAETVADKVKANFCDFFTPDPNPQSRDSGDVAAQLKAAEALFK